MPITNEVKNYVKYNSGNYSNKFISKKTNISMNKLLNLQKRLDVQVSNRLIGYDFIILEQVYEKTGLNKNSWETLIKHNHLNIEVKKIGKFTCITLDDLERITKFLNTYLKTAEVCRLLNIKDERYLEYSIKKGHIKSIKIGDRKHYNKIDIITLKQKLRDTLTIEDFANQVGYSIDSIYKMIKKKKITCEKVLCKFRIAKTELNKFK